MNYVELYLALLAGTTMYYTFFLTRIRIGLLRLNALPLSGIQPKVTVIVAARNEEAHIARCMESILSQDYPGGKFDLIVVDDESGDRTAEIVRAAGIVDKRVRLLQLPSRPEGLVGRKPEAVALAMAEADGEIVITTDADCTHPRTWLRSMSSYFEPTTALVAGPVVLEPGKTFFDEIEQLDFLGLVTAGAGLIGAGRPIICNGANLAFRTSAYRLVQDRTQFSSNDDGTLMSRIVTRNIGGIRFASTPHAVVRTEPTGSVQRFFRQRMRWAAVRGRFLDWTIYGELVLLFAFFLTLLAVLALAFAQPLLLIPVGIVLVGKAIMDFFALRIGARICGITISPFVFLLAELFHGPSIVVAALMSVVVPFQWKGRRFKR